MHFSFSKIFHFFRFFHVSSIISFVGKSNFLSSPYWQLFCFSRNRAGVLWKHWLLSLNRLFSSWWCNSEIRVKIRKHPPENRKMNCGRNERILRYEEPAFRLSYLLTYVPPFFCKLCSLAIEMHTAWPIRHISRSCSTNSILWLIYAIIRLSFIVGHL